ncbi:ecto-ADP-ribosyltransferase 5-like, partial [Leucoraja erinacea]|uniref:ecto-ADP-ribosyltransferase 5-like n=1 Tax=Leucoraja erinaceus TaxID=7782 RepID=UPI0024546997
SGDTWRPKKHRSKTPRYKEEARLDLNAHLENMRGLALSLFILLCLDRKYRQISDSRQNRPASPVEGGMSCSNMRLGVTENKPVYMFTQSEASDQLAIEYLQGEKGRTPAFAKAWGDAEVFMRNNKRIQVPVGLRDQHVLAILAYTSKTDLHWKFNDALQFYQANDTVYAEKFNFKSFHYLLSVALDRLRSTSGPAAGTTYRGIKNRSKAQEGCNMTFGQFASSSRDMQTARGFGTATVFNITSLKGVYIASYSLFQKQREVLIPPDEVFKVARYFSGDKGDEISLEAVGEAGIAVKVEREADGDMQVVRSVGAALYAVALWCAVAVLAPIFL